MSATSRVNDLLTHQQSLSAYLRDLSAVVAATQATGHNGEAIALDVAASRTVALIRQSAVRGNKVMLIGNGGSAAVASHVHNDLCKAAGVKAMVFTEPSLLTALSNDIEYAAAYEYPVKLWASAGDMLLAVSSSGESRNILRAVQAATRAGCTVITFSGFGPDNALRTMGDINFYCGSSVYGHVETSHAALTHYLTDCLTADFRAGKNP